MTTVTQITGAEAVDDTRYHVFTDRGIFLLDITYTYNYVRGVIPTFDTVEDAVNYFNNK